MKRTRHCLSAVFASITLLCVIPLSKPLTARPLATRYTVSFQTNTDMWCSSVGWGQPLTADASSRGEEEWFWLYDLNGGDLEDEDVVVLTTFWTSTAPRDHEGLSIIDSEAPVLFSEPTPLGSWPDHQWILRTLDCDSCVIGDGTKLAIQNQTTGKYLTAVNGGGANVDATATSVGSNERFEISF